MNDPQILINQSLREKIIYDLSHKLHPNYTYHNLDHTLRVINASYHIANYYNIEKKELTILLTASLLHDYGFIQTHENHEEIGVRLSKEILPNYNFSLEDIQKIESLILVTNLSKKPNNLLESIIRDADLEYLGSKDFSQISPLLMDEWFNCGIIKDDKEFHKIQYEFLKKHSFFTDFMSKEFNNQNQKNILAAKKILDSHQ